MGVVYAMGMPRGRSGVAFMQLKVLRSRMRRGVTLWEDDCGVEGSMGKHEDVASRLGGEGEVTVQRRGDEGCEEAGGDEARGDGRRPGGCERGGGQSRCSRFSGLCTDSSEARPQTNPVPAREGFDQDGASWLPCIRARCTPCPCPLGQRGATCWVVPGAPEGSEGRRDDLKGERDATNAKHPFLLPVGAGEAAIAAPRHSLA